MQISLNRFCRAIYKSHINENSNHCVTYMDCIGNRSMTGFDPPVDLHQMGVLGSECIPPPIPSLVGIRCCYGDCTLLPDIILCDIVRAWLNIWSNYMVKISIYID